MKMQNKRVQGAAQLPNTAIAEATVAFTKALGHATVYKEGLVTVRCVVGRGKGTLLLFRRGKGEAVASTDAGSVNPGASNPTNV